MMTAVHTTQGTLAAPGERRADGGSVVGHHVLEAARRGEQPAVAELLACARPALRRYAERRCFVSDVEDAVQEALLTVSRRIGRLRHARALTTWMFRIVRRECHRLARTTLRVDLWDDERMERVLSGLSDEALRLEIAAAVESLPPHYREVVLLRDFEELTIAEIARRLDLPVPATKSRLHRARVLVREFLVG
jgi:RNA polymerase sigma factor (sigma-70 family)